jgi:hypothetical protein
MDEILVAQLRQHDSNTADRNELGDAFLSSRQSHDAANALVGRVCETLEQPSRLFLHWTAELTELLKEAEPLTSSSRW